jgi:hypothetical protein
MTTKVIFKVLWVDDQNLDENNELTKFYDGWQLKASKYNIELVPFDNWEEAETSLRNNFDDYSAIILDVNCKIHKSDIEQEEFITAVLPSLSKIFGEKRRMLPWYLLSAGKGTNFGTTVNGARYQHSKHEEDWGSMLYLKEAKEGANTPDRLFENITQVAKDTAVNVVLFRHQDTFCYLGQYKLIDARARKLMLRMLSALYFPEENIGFEYQGNPLRKVLEYVFRSARKQGVLSPYCFDKDDHVNLTYSSLYLKGDAVKLNRKEPDSEITIRWSDGTDCVFPENVANIVRGILVYANVDSHTYEIDDMPYIVDENSKDLFFGYVLQLCYVIKCYGEFVRRHPDIKKNQCKQVENVITERSTMVIEKYEGARMIVEKDEKNNYHCGQCRISFKKAQEFLGKYVTLFNVRENTAKSVDTYPYYADFRTKDPDIKEFTDEHKI